MNLCKNTGGVLFQGKRKTNVAKASYHRLTFDPLAEANGNKGEKAEMNFVGRSQRQLRKKKTEMKVAMESFNCRRF